MFHKVFEKRKLSTGIIITFQVMAFSGMSPGNPHPVGSLTKGSQGKLRAHTPSTGNSDNPYIWWILHSTSTRQICGTITAPVA
jgi:hypothetical protein